MKRTTGTTTSQSRRMPPEPGGATKGKKPAAALKEARIDLPEPDLDRKGQILDKLKIKKPLEIDDSQSVLTIDPGVGATQVDTYATVPKGKQHDGLFVKLTQTDWSTARVEGPGVDTQSTLPPRTMAGAFGFWAAQNGPMNLAKKDYGHSELDRKTGEVVLSSKSKSEDGVTVLEQRRLRPGQGAELSGEMLTAMPPKVGLVGFPEEYAPEPGVLAATPKTKNLKQGATLHISGQSIESIRADVTSAVRPGKDGWTNPKGASVGIDTWLRVQNTDRAAIQHDEVVLRSAEATRSRYSYRDSTDGPSTVHITSLKGAGLKVGPGETQEILVESQKGKAHVEYRLSDSITNRPAGKGQQSMEETADRYMVLDSSQGKRHAGEVRFYDGTFEIGSAQTTSAAPGSSSTTSDRKGSGVTSDAVTKWSALQPGSSSIYKKQTVTRDYNFSNISAVAGQVKLHLDLDSFQNINSVKINGKKLTSSLKNKDFTATMESERWGGSNIEITLNIGAGSDKTPASSALKIEVDGQFRVYS